MNPTIACTCIPVWSWPAEIGETPSAGLIPRALAELFAESAAASDGDALNTRITLSYMEIYNERIHDLLQPYKSSARLDPQVCTPAHTGRQAGAPLLGLAVFA